MRIKGRRKLSRKGAKTQRKEEVTKNWLSLYEMAMKGMLCGFA
jgi:hypothetical protein